MMKKKLIISFLCVLVLFVIFLLFSHFLRNDSSKMIQYDMDAKDSPHFKLGEKIKIGESDFIINGFDLSKNENNLKNYELKMMINQKDYENLENGYTFMLANNDTLIKKTNCIYEKNTINVVEVEKSTFKNPNQIVVIDNKNFKIVATLDLNEYK